jgi:hypothetical protein
MLDLFNTYRADAQHIASVLLALAIWRWGGGPERWLIAVFIATMVIPVHVLQLLIPGHPAFGSYSGIYAAIDLLAGFAFVAIALQANRNYPLWIAGFQLVAIASHGVSAVVDTVSPIAYAILVVGPSYCQLLLIMGGFVRHILRTRRFGLYRDWRRTVPREGWLKA